MASSDDNSEEIEEKAARLARAEEAWVHAERDLLAARNVGPTTTPGERLREARKSAGLAVGELGRRAALQLGRDRPISASAVRNQENGTNGIPMDLARAYAEVLGVHPGYIIFGDLKNRATPVIIVGRISDQGSPMYLSSPEFRLNPAEIIQVEVPDYLTVALFGLRVEDESLSPEYEKGDILIFARTRSTGIRAGDRVAMLAKAEAHHAPAQFKVTLRGVERAGDQHIFRSLHDGGEFWAVKDRDAALKLSFGVVVASYRLVPPRAGPLL